MRIELTETGRIEPDVELRIEVEPVPPLVIEFEAADIAVALDDGETEIVIGWPGRVDIGRFGR